MRTPVYLDHHATTPLDARVFEAMEPFLKEDFGNAASAHAFGWRAKKAVDLARSRVAALIGAEENEIIFTSGATEANNTALKGVAARYGLKGSHLLTVATEHKAVLDVCESLKQNGFEATYLPVDGMGRLDLDALECAINDTTFLVSVMHANNEIGLVHPIEKVGGIVKSHELFFHVDAAQSAGKIPVDVKKIGADLLSFSGHKLYGPKGVGVLYVRQKNPYIRLMPLLHGGGHESGLRSGTLNVPGIVGLGMACEIAGKEMAADDKRIGALRDRLESGLQKELDHVEVNGDPQNRLPNNLNMSFACVESESLLMAINDTVAVSSGSACTAGSVDTSHVLKALGLTGERMHTAIRFGVGRFNTEEEIDYVIKKVAEAVQKLRAVSPLYDEVKKLK